MRSVSRRRVADFVSPALSEVRIARMWSAIAESERARRRESEGPASTGRLVTRWRAIPILAAALVAAVLLIVFRLRSPSSPAMAGLLIDTGAALQEVSLPDGSTLNLSAATRLRVISVTAAEIRLRLERGSVTCDVVHREGRRFVVAAGDVEVEDRGTRFAIDVRPGEDRDVVAVRVEHGAVEVRDAAQAIVATLRPGQDWKSRSPEAPRVPDSGEPAGTGLPAPSASPSIAEPAAAPSSSAGARSGRGAITPQGLFERADAARLAGRHADAAADFERFYRRFPNDPRAGLAAYELGRIRLGSLHDPRGAAEAFAAVLDRTSDPFREDAEAGRVEALADLGDHDACVSARDAFRARYPRSPLTGRVAKLCGGP